MAYDKEREEKRKQLNKLAQEGEVRRLNGQYTEAIRLFTEALKIDGNYAWAHAHRGAAHAAIDNWDPCRADFERALALKPSYGWAHAHYGDAHRSHAIYRLGTATTPAAWQEQHDLIDAGIAHFDKAAELSEGSAWTFAHRGAAYTYKHWLEVMPRVTPRLDLIKKPLLRSAPRPAADVPRLAMESFNRAFELNPRYAWAYAFKACLLALLAREQPDMKPGLLVARDCLLKALILDVNKRLLIDRPIAELLSCAGTYDESITAGISGVEKNPSDHVSRYFIAVGLKHQQDPLAPVVIEQTRKVLEAARREINTMLHGLDVLDGRDNMGMIEKLQQNMCFEAIALVAFDPTWSTLREKLPSPPDRQDPRAKDD
ncbi:tetratricopeptide repeat protein [Sorangium sp. So ce854]|uniref:tetratricopeptide repeat protein n=1 Tax=Sorangium sp. So ce854 TaxID=3133322 RepID=UPI003F640300